MATSLFPTARSAALVLSTLAAIAALACGTAVDSHSELTPPPPPTGGAGTGGSGGSSGSGGSGGYIPAGGTGGGSSPACGSQPSLSASASYLGAGPDAGGSGVSVEDAGTPPADGGALDGGGAPDDAGGDLSVPRRIRVVVNSVLPFEVGSIERLGPGVVLLREPTWSGQSKTIDLLVSTSQPWINIMIYCDEGGPGPRTIELVLRASSIDASVSTAHRNG